jgi:4-amino-4-deoxy-L-arabinose transferase-like glycosyltransferase
LPAEVVSATVALPATGAAVGWSRLTLALADIASLLGLSVLAGVVRWPHLLTIPRFTDEQIEVLWTLPIYRLETFPLASVDPYNGPLYNYLLAAALWLLGPEPHTPRLFSLLVGSLTVAGTYLLGRRLGGRPGGLVAAGLLLTCATHVLVNSHVAWSNATTPLFTTLAFWVLLPAVVEASGPSLALGGLAFALALQTHPSVALFFPGLALAILVRQPSLLRSRWLIVAGALFALGYANMLVYNLVPGLQDFDRGSLVRGEHQQRTYAGGGGGPAFYLANLGSLALNLPRVAASLIDSRSNWSDYLLNPSFWLYGGVLLAGLAWPLRQGNPVPLLGGGSFLLLLPLLNGRFEPIFDGRYLMPVLPLAFAGFGAFVSETMDALGSRWLRLALTLAVVALVIYPLLPLARYEQRAAPEGQLNLDLIQSAATLDLARRTGESIILDNELGRRNLPADGDFLQSLRVLLELRSVSYRVAPTTAAKLDGEIGQAPSALVAFALPYERGLDERFRIERIEDKTGGRYGTFRVERR